MGQDKEQRLLIYNLQFSQINKLSGCLLPGVFYIAGSGLDIYRNPATGQKRPVPRHAEIDNRLAERIRQCLGLK